jgi:hypothetical protein
MKDKEKIVMAAREKKQVAQRDSPIPPKSHSLNRNLTDQERVV